MARDQITVHIDVTGLRQAMARFSEALGRALVDCCSMRISLDEFREEAEAGYQRRFSAVLDAVREDRMTINQARENMGLPPLDERPAERRQPAVYEERRYVTQEMADDNIGGFLVPEWITAEIVRRMAEAEDARILWGVPGAPEPAGIMGFPVISVSEDILLNGDPNAPEPTGLIASHVNARCAGPDWDAHWREERRRWWDERSRVASPMGDLRDAFAGQIEEYRKAEKDRQAANERARELLVSCLNDGQKETFEKYHYFEVHAQDDLNYRVYERKTFNVTTVQNSYCAQLGGRYMFSIYDQMLAQKLCLETDVKHFLAVANKTGPRPPSDVAERPRIEINMDDFSWIP